MLLACLAGCADSNQDERNEEKLGAAAEHEGLIEGNALVGQMKSDRADGQ